MSNQSENREFRNVCNNLEMSTEERNGFHRYLANRYNVEKDDMDYEAMLAAGVEYLRNEIGREPPYRYRNL